MLASSGGVLPRTPPAGEAASIARAARLLCAGRHNVALTGAGISTESGLPDFRSPQGLWAGTDPASVASLAAFRRDPAAFYTFYRERLAALGDAVPNAAHLALADLEARGAVHMVVTQNVDGLHQRAGTRAAIELHGNLRQARCHGCGARSPIGTMVEALDAHALPRCRRCGDLLRPDVVLFEEVLPADAYARAEQACRRCDVLLVVGSSLQVYPAAGLPGVAAARGATLVVVNREPTSVDASAAAVFRDDAGRVLPSIADAVAAIQTAQAEEAQR